MNLYREGWGEYEWFTAENSGGRYDADRSYWSDSFSLGTGFPYHRAAFFSALLLFDFGRPSLDRQFKGLSGAPFLFRPDFRSTVRPRVLRDCLLSTKPKRIFHAFPGIGSYFLSAQLSWLTACLGFGARAGLCPVRRSVTYGLRLVWSHADHHFLLL